MVLAEPFGPGDDGVERPGVVADEPVAVLRIARVVMEDPHREVDVEVVERGGEGAHETVTATVGHHEQRRRHDRAFRQVRHLRCRGCAGQR